MFLQNQKSSNEQEPNDSDTKSRPKRESDDFRLFLKQIKRSSEGLEQGQKIEFMSPIELDQIGIFFTRIAAKSEKSPEGCQLLAQNGIDTVRTEKLFQNLRAEENSSHQKIKGDTDHQSQSKSYRFTSSIERFQLRNLEEIVARWDTIKELDRLQFSGDSLYSHFDAEKVIDRSQSLSNSRNQSETDIADLHAIQTEDAKWFATELREMEKASNHGQTSSPHIMITFIEILKKFRNQFFPQDYCPTEEDFYNSHHKIVQFITGIITLFELKGEESKLYDDDDMLKSIKDGCEKGEKGNTFKSSVQCSFLQNICKYLELKARTEKFPGLGLGTITLEEFNEYFRKNPQKRDHDKWRHIWNILRCGLKYLFEESKDNFIPGIDHQIPGDNYKSFRKLFKEPSSENPGHEDPAIDQCFCFVSLTDDIDTDTPDLFDFIYLTIKNMLKSIEREPNQDQNNNEPAFQPNDKVTFFKDLRDEIDPADFELEFPFDQLFIDLFTMKTDALLNDLTMIISDPYQNPISIFDQKDIPRRFPVITANMYFAFYSVGLVDPANAYQVKEIINDLVDLLPKESFADVSLSYLLRSRSEIQLERLPPDVLKQKSDIIKYLLSLNLDRPLNLTDYLSRFYEEQKTRYTDIRPLIQAMHGTIDFLKILALFGFYDDVAEQFYEITKHIDQYPIESQLVLFEIAKVLLNKKKLLDEKYDEDNKLQPYLRLIYHSLLYSNSIDITVRSTLIESSIELHDTLNEILDTAKKWIDNRDTCSYDDLVNISENYSSKFGQTDLVGKILKELLEKEYSPSEILEKLNEKYQNVYNHIDEIIRNSKELYHKMKTQETMIDFDAYRNKITQKIKECRDKIEIAQNDIQSRPQYLTDLLENSKNDESIQRFVNGLFDPTLDPSYAEYYVEGIYDHVHDLSNCLSQITRDQERLNAFLQSIAGNANESYRFLIQISKLNEPNDYYLALLEKITQDERIFNFVARLANNPRLKDLLIRHLNEEEVYKLIGYLQQITHEAGGFNSFIFIITNDLVTFLSHINQISNITDLNEADRDILREITKNSKEIDDYLKKEMYSSDNISRCNSQIQRNCDDLYKVLVEITKNDKKLQDFLIQVTKDYKNVHSELVKFSKPDYYGVEIRKSPEKLLYCIYEMTKNPTKFQTFLQNSIKDADGNFIILMELNKAIKIFEKFIDGVRKNPRVFIDGAIENSEHIRNYLSDMHDKSMDLRDIFNEITKSPEKLRAFLNNIDKSGNGSQYYNIIDQYKPIADTVCECLRIISEYAVDLHTDFQEIKDKLHELHNKLDNTDKEVGVNNQKSLVTDQKMKNQVADIRQQVTEMCNKNKKTVRLIESLINVSLILNYFESGNTEKAMELAYMTGSLLPFTRSDVHNSKYLELLREAQTKDIPAFHDCVAYIILHLASVESQNEKKRDELASIFEFFQELNLNYPFKENTYAQIIDACQRANLI